MLDDLPNQPDRPLNRRLDRGVDGAGDAVTLLGSEGEARLDAKQIASTAGTISYDVLCQIRARVRRVYV